MIVGHQPTSDLWLKVVFIYKYVVRRSWDWGFSLPLDSHLRCGSCQGKLPRAPKCAYWCNSTTHSIDPNLHLSMLWWPWNVTGTFHDLGALLWRYAWEAVLGCISCPRSQGLHLARGWYSTLGTARCFIPVSYVFEYSVKNHGRGEKLTSWKNAVLLKEGRCVVLYIHCGAKYGKQGLIDK